MNRFAVVACYLLVCWLACCLSSQRPQSQFLAFSCWPFINSCCCCCCCLLWHSSSSSSSSLRQLCWSEIFFGCCCYCKGRRRHLPFSPSLPINIIFLLLLLLRIISECMNLRVLFYFSSTVVFLFTLHSCYFFPLPSIHSFRQWVKRNALWVKENSELNEKVASLCQVFLQQARTCQNIKLLSQSLSLYDGTDQGQNRSSVQLCCKKRKELTFFLHSL